MIAKQLTFGMAPAETRPCQCGGAYVPGRFSDHVHISSGPRVARPPKSRHSTVRRAAIAHSYAVSRLDENDDAENYSSYEAYALAHGTPVS